MRDRGRSKSKELVEDYVSPYNRDMLASGLPLKTLITGSKEAYNTEKKAKRKHDKENSKRSRKGLSTTRSKGFKLRTASRSRSRSRNGSARKSASRGGL
jgi:hypothetical protein